MLATISPALHSSIFFERDFIILDIHVCRGRVDQWEEVHTWIFGGRLQVVSQCLVSPPIVMASQ